MKRCIWSSRSPNKRIVKLHDHDISFTICVDNIFRIFKSGIKRTSKPVQSSPLAKIRALSAGSVHSDLPPCPCVRYPLSADTYQNPLSLFNPKNRWVKNLSQRILLMALFAPQNWQHYNTRPRIYLHALDRNNNRKGIIRTKKPPLFFLINL